MMRHGDGGLALFNGSKEETAALVELVLTQAGRGGRGPLALAEGGFSRMQAGRSVLLVDCGVPAPPGLDRFAHAGTLSMELSVGRDRLIVNCGAFIAGPAEWHDAARATAAHSTLVIGDLNSSELKPEGLGRRPTVVEVNRQEAAGAHWLDVSHDGWKKSFNALHRRRLYMAESGEDIRGEDLIEAPEPQPFTLRFPPASGCSGQRAAGWRGGASAAEIRHVLASACRWGTVELGRNDLSGRRRTPARRADRVDRLRRWPPAYQVGIEQS